MREEQAVSIPEAVICVVMGHFAFVNDLCCSVVESLCGCRSSMAQ